MAGSFVSAGSVTSDVGICLYCRSDNHTYSEYFRCRDSFLKAGSPNTTVNKKEGTMFSIYSDLKNFVREHRGVLFTILFVVLLDKYLFEGALRERLKGVIGGLLSKAERIANKE